mgnify:CR=1 FL=1
MATRGQAINEKCKDCIYDPKAPGNWRQQVTGCTSIKCALWPFRPVSKPKTRTPTTHVAGGSSNV